MDPTTLALLLAMLALLANTAHCIILGKRIDNLHERIRLTLNSNGLFDFWNPNETVERPKQKVTAGMSENGVG